ncbi:pentapeptide repeat-containing protein [Sorangium sp. So ce269]
MLAMHRKWLMGVSSGAAEAQGTRLALYEHEISECVVEDETLSDAELVRCIFQGLVAKRCDFSYANMIDAVLERASLLDCDFRKADMRSARCAGAMFSGSDLARADFTDADLRGTILRNCNLGGAWLINADLRDAELENVSLNETRFVGTKLDGVKHWRVDELETAHFDSVDIGGVHISGDGAMSYLRDLCLRNS